MRELVFAISSSLRATKKVAEEFARNGRALLGEDVHTIWHYLTDDSLISAGLRALPIVVLTDTVYSDLSVLYRRIAETRSVRVTCFDAAAAPRDLTAFEAAFEGRRSIGEHNGIPTSADALRESSRFKG